MATGTSYLAPADVVIIALYLAATFAVALWVSYASTCESRIGLVQI